MSEIDVRILGEDDWQDFRAVRLTALQDSPDAFVATHGEESSYDEALWRERLRRSTRLLAEREGEVVGVVSVGRANHNGSADLGASSDAVGELFGLWVAPAQRGHGVASRLVQAGAEAAQAGGSTHLSYWVGTDNGRAVAFASGMGFRPTDNRRPMKGASHADEEEIAMILSLRPDRVV